MLVNVPFLPFYDLTFKTLAMPVEIIPGAPEKVRLFWQAYFWILVTTLLALPFLKPTRAQLGKMCSPNGSGAPRARCWPRRSSLPSPTSSTTPARGLDWKLADPNLNMVTVLANAASGAFGQLYPFAAPYLGLLGGFVCGSEASAIAMLTALHLTTAEKIGAVGLVVAAASGIGGGLASVISPAKLQNAAAAIDRIGEEGGVLRVTFVVSLVITLVCALMTLLWGF